MGGQIRLRILVPAGTTCAPETLSINYLSPLLAVMTGIVHAGLAPVILVGGVKPNIILIAVVLVTCVLGFMPGITWAFAGGLTANLLVGEPLGSIPLVLLAVAAVVAGGQRIFGRLTWLYPLLAVFAGSLLADVAGRLLFELVEEPFRSGIPMQLILPAAVLNTAIAAVLLFPVRALAVRYARQEDGAW
jgi:rod shape-determining protein MreD